MTKLVFASIFISLIVLGKTAPSQAFPNAAQDGIIIDAVTTYNDGFLLKGSGPTVYIMFHDAKTAAPGPALIMQLGLSLSKIIEVSDDTLGNIPDGSKGEDIPIYRPDGI